MKRTISVILSIALIMAFAITSLGLTAVAVKSIQLSTEKITLRVGKAYTLKVTIAPNNATNQKLTFSSSNKNVATVDSKGIIKGKKVGQAVITAVSVSNKKLVAKCKVTVSTVDISRKVALKIILIFAGTPADMGKVYGELSKLSLRDINATVSVENMKLGDWRTKYPLLFASGANYDIVYAANWTDWRSFALKGAFLPLSMSKIQQFMPNTYKNTPKIAWTSTALGGTNYIIPQAVQEYNGQLFGIRGDLRAKYNLPEVKTFDDLVTYMDTIAKNEKDIIPFALNKDSAFRTTFFQPDIKNLFTGGSINPSNNMSIGNGEWDTKGNVTAHSIFDEAWFKGYVDTMNAWTKKGYWSQSALVQSPTDSEMFESGKSAVCYWTLDQMGALASRLNLSHPEWKMEITDVEADMERNAAPYECNGLAINLQTPNADRALMLIDLLKYNRDYFDLTWYGIKGVHFEAIGDTLYKPLADSSKYPPSAQCPWGWRTQLERWDSTKPVICTEINKSWKERYTEYPYMFGYKLIDTNVKNEKAALISLGAKYIIPMAKGFMDYQTGSSEYLAAAKKAGIDKIIAETQAQIAEWDKTH